jgi:ankyrin repeat protein
MPCSLFQSVLLGKDKTGDTPLWCAARFGRTAVVKLLLERNDVNAKRERRKRRDAIVLVGLERGQCYSGVAIATGQYRSE